jgi:hypothetical protein
MLTSIFTFMKIIWSSLPTCFYHATMTMLLDWDYNIFAFVCSLPFKVDG